MGRNCLWITPKWPLPPEDGARVAPCTLLRSLTDAGEQIDLLALAGIEEVIDAEEARSRLGLRNIFVLRRAPATQNKLKLLTMCARRPLLPITFGRYAEGRLRRAAERLFDGDPEGCDVISRADDAPLAWEARV